MRLIADVVRMNAAGDGLKALASDLQHSADGAASAVRRAEHAVGDDRVAAALRQLGGQLFAAEHTSLRAIAVFGEQVKLAAASYQATDQSLARHVPDETA